MAEPAPFAELSRCNLRRLEEGFVRELSRLSAASADEIGRALEVERAEVGADPPLAVNMTLRGLATVIENRRLFSVWDVLDGTVAIPESLRGVPSLAESNWSRRRRETVEGAVGRLLGEARRPIYGALSSTTGYDRLSGGMFDHRAYPVTIEVPWTSAALFHWGDSFDAIGVDDQRRFDPEWCLAPAEALRAKAMMNLIRRRNFPIAGRKDYGTEHPAFARLLTITPRVTSLWIEGFIYDAPPLARAELLVRPGAIAGDETHLWAGLRERIPGRFGSWREMMLP